MTTSSRPKPVLVCREEFRGVMLDVRNEGESAIFSCEVRFISISPRAATVGVKPNQTIRLNRLGNLGRRKVTLPRGGGDSLLLAQRVADQMRHEVVFPYTKEPPGVAFTIAWLGAYAVPNEGEPTLMHQPQVVLEVTVLTEPSVNDEIVKRRYEIDAFGHCIDLGSWDSSANP